MYKFFWFWWLIHIKKSNLAAIAIKQNSYYIKYSPTRSNFQQYTMHGNFLPRNANAMRYSVAVINFLFGLPRRKPTRRRRRKARDLRRPRTKTRRLTRAKWLTNGRSARRRTTHRIPAAGHPRSHRGSQQSERPLRILSQRRRNPRGLVHLLLQRLCHQSQRWRKWSNPKLIRPPTRRSARTRLSQTRHPKEGSHQQPNPKMSSWTSSSLSRTRLSSGSTTRALTTTILTLPTSRRKWGGFWPSLSSLPRISTGPPTSAAWPCGMGTVASWTLQPSALTKTSAQLWSPLLAQSS